MSYTGTSPMEQRGSTTAIPEEVTLDYAEISSIPPLPLWTLLAADKEIYNLATSNRIEEKVFILSLYLLSQLIKEFNTL